METVDRADPHADDVRDGGQAAHGPRAIGRVADAPFLWATGIEDTFIAAPWQRTQRVMDEYELTDHYAQWDTDLDLIRQLGVPAARYGVPWYRINPAPGRWSWDWCDRVLERMVSLRIDPIIDLIHYGTPAWLERAFLDPDYPARVAEFAAHIADRYRGRIRCFTPMNEPRITAWYCGYLGWWPPYARGWRGFVAVMLAACRGVVQTEAALRAVGDVRIVHVDATDLYRTDDPTLAAEAAHRQRLVFLALDLVSGRVDAQHPLHAWLLAQGARAEELDWFLGHPLSLDVVGLNMYPMFTLKHVERRGGGRPRVRMRYADGSLLETLAAMYWQRYRRPLMITETASLGSVRRRRAWLDESLTAVRVVRGRGIPLIGYTWWPLYSLVAWSYRQSTRPLERYWLRMGLWDVDPGPGLRRVRTSLVDAYRELVAGGDAAVGPVLTSKAASM